MHDGIAKGESGWHHLAGTRWLCGAILLGCGSGDARTLSVQEVQVRPAEPSEPTPSALGSPATDGAMSDGTLDRIEATADAVAAGNYGTPSRPTACPGCQIGARCFAAGDHDPANPCRLCAPASNATTWSNEPDGTACDDRSACSVDDVCSSGACSGTPRDCSDTRACTAGERCDPALGCVPGVARCEPGESCLPSGECGLCNVEQCNVDGSCFDPGQQNPSNPCERCDPAASTTAWSPLDDGSSCDDGKACTGADACASGVCTSSERSCDDGVFCNGVETCVEEKGECHPAGGTSPCAVGCIESERMCAGTVGRCIERDVGARFCSESTVFACDDDGVADPLEECAFECQEDERGEGARCRPVDGSSAPSSPPSDAGATDDDGRDDDSPDADTGTAPRAR